MSPLVTHFDPQPAPGDLPARLPSPFDPGPPHPIARRAADELLARLRGGWPVATADLEGGRGKMFGVLVVQDGGGRVGYLRGFSGMLAGTWNVEGFVAPLFDEAARDRFWPAGEAELVAFDREIEDLTSGPALTSLRASLAALDAQHAAAATAQAAEHELRRQQRDDRRQRPPAGPERDAFLHALAQESRADAAAARRRRADAAAARHAITEALRVLEERHHALRRRRVARSCELLEHIFAGYCIGNGSGLELSLREIFAPHTPPGGSGDCAAPKLFGHALRAGLRPVALAEVWWGPPPPAGGRHAGVFYPACRGKCGPVLAHMLAGLGAEPAPVFGGGSIAPEEPRVVYEDEWLLVVDKPAGLLSVPGRAGALRDSVQTRLAARHPGATGPMIVHRLDLDTSGLMLVAKDAETHTALQGLFLKRQIDKRYVAWLDGQVAGDSGVVELALRVDVDDRPRQIHDPVHGKAARTEWRVLARAGGRTRVAFFPRTGRTHQLRVHAAHPQGLGAPIAGDRLYGRRAGDERLMLHAEALAFAHPRTGRPLRIERSAPF